MAATSPKESSTRLPAPLLIDGPERVTLLENALKDVHRLAIDTESNSLFAYHERTCLIQISTDEQDFLVDPIQMDILEHIPFLGNILGDPGVEKVLHAAEYDVMCLKRDFGFQIRNLFDTIIGVRVLGWENFGLAHLLEHYYGVEVNKRHQRANWGKRPLTLDLIRYAQVDTHYLLPIRDQVEQQLIEAGHLEEAREISEDMCRAEWREQPFDPDGFWKIQGVKKLDATGLAILKELYLFREHVAEERDFPVFKVIGNKALITIAEARPRSMNDLRLIPGLGGTQVKRYGQHILKRVQRGLSAPRPQRPSRGNGRPPRSIVSLRLEALYAWRKDRADARGVSSDIIMSKDTLQEMAEAAPRSIESLARLETLGPWRLSTYGEEVLELLAEIG
jgi:ribonuclease D